MSKTKQCQNSSFNLITMVLIFTMILVPMKAFAASAPLATEEGKVTGILLVEHGQPVYLEGNTAQKYYDNLISQPKIESGILEVPDRSHIIPRLTMAPRAGSVKYGYYYTETSNGKSNGTTVRVTPYAKNQTSTTQSIDVNLSVSASWSINSTITGKWKDAVTASLGRSWTKTYSTSTGVKLSVSP